MFLDKMEKAERILAIRLDNIGDMVMLGPSLRSLREFYPSSRITLMASPAGTQIAKLLPWVDDTLTWRASWQDISGNILYRSSKRISVGRYPKNGKVRCSIHLYELLSITISPRICLLFGWNPYSDRAIKGIWG
jgi:hypothetical protein